MGKILFANTLIQGELDGQQLNAVQAPIGNICINAVAGSGKTRVLTYRVSNLIENGINESEIVLLTFTGKAANEMISRVKEVLNKKELNLVYGTFHSVSCMFLRAYGEKIGLNPTFGVITPGEQAAFMQAIKEEHIKIYFNGDTNALPDGYTLAEIYTGAINKDIPFYKYMTENYSKQISALARDNVMDFFEKYEEYKENHNKLDYDDMLLKFIDLLTFVPEVKTEINTLYKHLLVDEYQDINWMQHEILKLLNANNSLYVIGDKSQCIYQFRGSRPDYITNFIDDFSPAQTYPLDNNYRSSENILSFAQNSIEHNGYPVVLNASFSNKKPVTVKKCQTKDEEIDYIITDIQSRHLNELDKVAILTRTGKQQSVILNALKEKKINTYISRDNLMELPYIKELVSFMFLCENPDTPLCYKEALKTFKGVGEKMSEDVLTQLRSNGCNISKVTSRYDVVVQSCTVLGKIVVPSKNYIAQNKKPLPLNEMISLISDSFYNTSLSEAKIRFINRIKQASLKYSNVSGFADALRNGDILISSKKPSLSVMTMHSSKGLEWEYVYLPFVTNNSFPSVPFWEINSNSEAVCNERNLFYVATTRAKEELNISYSTESLNEKYPAGPSKFITEIDKRLYKNI